MKTNTKRLHNEQLNIKLYQCSNYNGNFAYFCDRKRSYRVSIIAAYQIGISNNGIVSGQLSTNDSNF